MALWKDQENTHSVLHSQKFHVHKTNIENGNAIIKLDKFKNADGHTGFAKLIIDEDQNQILKSTITIYESNNLTDEKLATIVRHEMDHALELAHSTAPEDLMHSTIQTEYPYISECDVDAIVGLYDGKSSSGI